MPALIATRRDVGAELALGARALAAKYGVPEMAMEVKNLELPGYDPAGRLRHERGLRHLRPGRLPHAHLSDRRRDPGGHRARPTAWRARRTRSSAAAWPTASSARTSARSSSAASGATSGRSTPTRSRRCCSHVWHEEFTEDDVMRTGRAHLEPGPALQPARGSRGRHLPRSSYEAGDAFAEGRRPARPSARRPSRRRLQEYYRLRGWDENGVPTEAKLAEIGVDVRL